MGYFKARHLLALVAFTVGCTKGAPSFETLDSSSIPQPTFSGLTFKAVSTSSPTSTFAIQGECDPRISDLKTSAGGVTRDIVIAASAVSITCASDRKFSFTLKSLRDLGFTITSDTSYEIQLIGVTDGGYSHPSVIRILLNTPKRISITSGSTESNAGERISVSTNFKAEVSLGHFVNDYPAGPVSTDQMNVKTSTHYKMKSGAAAAAD